MCNAMRMYNISQQNSSLTFPRTSAENPYPRGLFAPFAMMCVCKGLFLQQ